MHENVLGFTVDEARRRLSETGAAVSIINVSSKKGVTDADCIRVIRQAERDGTVVLSVSGCKTIPTASCSPELRKDAIESER